MTYITTVTWEGTIDSETLDAFIYNRDSSWDYARTVSTADSLFTTENSIYISVGHEAGAYRLNRGYLYFHWTKPSGSSIVDAKLLLYPEGKEGADSLVVQRDTTNVYPHEPCVWGDYDYSKYSGTYGIVALSSLIVDQWNTIPCSLDLIDSNTVKICLRMNWDIIDENPSYDTHAVILKSAETLPSKLVITYSAPVTIEVGEAIGDPYSINTISTINFCTADSLDPYPIYRLLSPSSSIGGYEGSKWYYSYWKHIAFKIKGGFSYGRNHYINAANKIWNWNQSTVSELGVAKIGGLAWLDPSNYDQSNGVKGWYGYPVNNSTVGHSYYAGYSIGLLDDTAWVALATGAGYTIQPDSWSRFFVLQGRYDYLAISNWKSTIWIKTDLVSSNSDTMAVSFPIDNTHSILAVDFPAVEVLPAYTLHPLTFANTVDNHAYTIEDTSSSLPSSATTEVISFIPIASGAQDLRSSVPNSFSHLRMVHDLGTVGSSLTYGIGYFRPFVYTKLLEEGSGSFETYISYLDTTSTWIPFGTVTASGIDNLKEYLTIKMNTFRVTTNGTFEWAVTVKNISYTGTCGADNIKAEVDVYEPNVNMMAIEATTGIGRGSLTAWNDSNYINASLAVLNGTDEFGSNSVLRVYRTATNISSNSLSGSFPLSWYEDAKDSITYQLKGSSIQCTFPAISSGNHHRFVLFTYLPYDLPYRSTPYPIYLKLVTDYIDPPRILWNVGSESSPTWLEADTLFVTCGYTDWKHAPEYEKSGIAEVRLPFKEDLENYYIWIRYKP